MGRSPLYSPNFHFKDIGGGGFVGILETLFVDEKNMLTRASVGFGWVAMIFSGFGTFGIRLHSSQISGMDLTLGLGFVGVNAYARAIYNELEKGLSGEVGVKFILPLIKL